jgi:transcriptional regulator with XRE-family HTH domain
MASTMTPISTGIPNLDHHLGGLAIGDNVIWYDTAGSLSQPFIRHFLHASYSDDKSLIYVNFDRSPRTLLEDLGPLARSSSLTILDCFTDGKGDGSDIFDKFYQGPPTQRPCRIMRMPEPDNLQKVMDAVYGIHDGLQGDVRLVFESLTGMQELWGGEEQVLKFYSRACPRLYELKTIAYWLIERDAHTQRLRANINQIAQVVVELALKRGKSTLSIVKALRRQQSTLRKPVPFWSDGQQVDFENEQQTLGPLNLSARLRMLRQRRGMSQKELALSIGVTPSTISQIEGNLIYPSLPALVKIAEVLSVDISAIFTDQGESARPSVFDGVGQSISVPDLAKDSIRVRRLLPDDYGSIADIYLVDIPAKKKISRHFFTHKGEEIGYLLSGIVQVTIRHRSLILRTGSIVYLTADTPSQWRNSGEEAARMLWLTLAP